MMNVHEWLGMWEPLDAPGKHSARIPVQEAEGYQFRLWGPYRVQTDGDCVIRAIPVEGTVTDVPPSWTQSPQVRFWLEKPRMSLAERLVRWLKGGAA